MNWFKTNPWLSLLPAALFLLLPFYGITAAFIESVKGNPWQHLLESERFFASLWFSLRTALIASLLSLMAGILLSRTFSKELLNLFPRLTVWLPMLFPHLVWGYVVLLFLSETGLWAQFFISMGLIDTSADFPIWTRDPNGVGIILTYIGKEVPFVMLMLFPVYSAIPSAYYDVVQTLGGSRWDQFKTVEWPHILPAVTETFFILFAFTLTAYEVPALLGTTYPEMLSVLSYEWFYNGDWDDRPLAFGALILVSIGIIFSSWLGYLYINRKRMRALRGRI
ncbi:ABC transporter permease [Halobacillus sp. Marseille-Q1614]|uniref:ABC transporter permease n=1 Tax=Halobacillus sp. Marseille-Q1614 TaxID=2709134 RepID=UPI00156FD60D|nr:ABC transporter permease subunit [Halobacillus sp. Marseille-Q1614]